ncbi:DMT family transporter [soil metagenome]
MTRVEPIPYSEPLPRPVIEPGKIGQYALLLVGVFACATSVLMLKASTSPPMVVAGMRLLIAAVVLSPAMIVQMTWPVFVHRSTKYAEIPSLRQLARSIPGAAFLAVHFITWAMGARMTNAANASLIVNLNPIALPVLMWLINRERVNRGEVIGTSVAMIGVLALMGQGYHLRDGSLAGDLMCFGSMLLFCLYICFGRYAGRGQKLWVYLVPMYAIAGVICLSAAVVSGVGVPRPDFHELLRWIGLALIPTVIGHSIFNHSIKHLRGQTISTINLSQFVFAGVLAYFIFGEVPPAKLYAVAAVIAAGVLIVIRSSHAANKVPTAILEPAE